MNRKMKAHAIRQKQNANVNKTTTIYKVFKFLILLFSVVLSQAVDRRRVRVCVCRMPGGNFSPDFCHCISLFAFE